MVHQFLFVSTEKEPFVLLKESYCVLSSVAAAEAAVAISIIINIYRNFKSINVEEADEMKY